MNWSRVKTILIIFFLCVDAFLAVGVLRGRNEQELTPEAVNTAVEVLKARGITVSPDIVVQKMTSCEHVEAENAVTGYDEFAVKVIGEDARLAADNIYEGAAGRIEFSGDCFNYTASAVPESGNIGTESEALRLAEDFARVLPGTDKADKSVSPISDGFSVTFRNKFNGMVFFNSAVTVDVQFGRVSVMHGSWFSRSVTGGRSNNLKSITSALIDCISAVGDSGPAEISSLELGYTVFEENTYHKSAVMIPVWQISLTDGRKFCIDARNVE